MRTLKFRAWDKEEKEMFCPTFTALDGISPRDFFNNADWIVMQFTGIKDKGNAEIYENDIVQDKYGNVYEVLIGGYWTDKADGTGFGVHFARNGNTSDYPTLPDGFERMMNYEVIGNIYESPELLKSC